MTETELEYQFCFNCNDRKQCYTKPKDCTRIQEEIGLQEMTNEEWLQSLNTEQLAEFLNAIIRVAPYDELEPKSFWEHLHPYDGGKKGIVEWLKQPHHSEQVTSK